MTVSPDGIGFRCDGIWASELHACRVLPVLGSLLWRRALQDWPFTFSSKPLPDRPGRVPDLTFVIPHRGAERAPLLRKVVESVFGQHGVSVECIVVEQDQERKLLNLPPAVRYLHVPCDHRPDSWHKCLAFNAGARVARSDILVCHDGDVLAPYSYGREILRLFQSGACVAYPQRFLFYLPRRQTLGLLSGRALPRMLQPESVRQNWHGGTLAIRRDAYWSVGGFDERFTGWTGEDIEFYDRCQTLQGWFYGFIPFVHLWHEPQPSKGGPEREANLAFFREILATSREDRIARLRQLPHRSGSDWDGLASS